MTSEGMCKLVIEMLEHYCMNEVEYWGKTAGRDDLVFCVADIFVVVVDDVVNKMVSGHGCTELWNRGAHVTADVWNIPCGECER